MRPPRVVTAFVVAALFGVTLQDASCFIIREETTCRRHVLPPQVAPAQACSCSCHQQPEHAPVLAAWALPVPFAYSLQDTHEPSAVREGHGGSCSCGGNGGVCACGGSNGTPCGGGNGQPCTCGGGNGQPCTCGGGNGQPCTCGGGNGQPCTCGGNKPGGGSCGGGSGGSCSCGGKGGVCTCGAKKHSGECTCGSKVGSGEGKKHKSDCPVTEIASQGISALFKVVHGSIKMVEELADKIHKDKSAKKSCGCGGRCGC